MLNRFFQTGSDIGRQLIERSCDLKLHLFKVNGKLACTFELQGSVNDPFEDEDEDDGDLLQVPACKEEEGLQFVRELFAEFERTRQR